MALPKESLENSIVVVAHPDDEVLWFSSILERVSGIVICFLDAGHSPKLGDARRKSLDEHACADRITLLDLEQVKSHNQSAWPEPEETDYGLRLGKDPGRDAAYREQAVRLEAALTPLVKRARNVFTHSPWGEYGHEDHVQLSRLATRLAGENGARVWYPGYVSNKSLQLMQRYVSGFETGYYTMPVDKRRAREIAEAYYRNDAWTFMEDFVWFDSECFIEGPLRRAETTAPGRLLPVNFLRLPFDPSRSDRRPGVARRLRRRARRILGRSNQGGGNVTAD